MKTNYDKGKLAVALNIIKELNISLSKAMEITNLPINERGSLINELVRHNIAYEN